MKLANVQNQKKSIININSNHLQIAKTSTELQLSFQQKHGLFFNCIWMRDVISIWSNIAAFYTKSFKQTIHSHMLPEKQGYIVHSFQIFTTVKISHTAS